MEEIVLLIWRFIIINYVLSLIGLVLAIALVIMQWKENKIERRTNIVDETLIFNAKAKKKISSKNR